MKTTITAITVVLLVSSVSFNIYQSKQLERSAKLFREHRLVPFGDEKMKLPVNGITSKDVAEILSQLPDFLKDKPDESGILEIQVCDDSHVIIQTGQMKGPLSGGGRYLGFIKTPGGWRFDPKSKNGIWVS